MTDSLSVWLYIAEFLFENSFIPMYICIFIHSSVSGSLGCSHILAVMGNAAVNMGVLMSLQDPDFNYFSEIPSSGVAGSCGSFLFNFF